MVTLASFLFVGCLPTTPAEGEGEGEGKSKYYKEVDLPSEVKGEIKRMYKHGVLEVRLEKEVKKEKMEEEKK